MSPTAPTETRLPTGIVTFLFTDIEGSTTLWEQHPAAMQAALARHDRLLRHAIERSNGSIVKSTGDGVVAVFAFAADALAACLSAQRALQEPDADATGPDSTGALSQPRIPLKVRMGLHTGAAELRDGDYFGATLNRANRIMSAANGGQVLLSAAAADLVQERLPEGVTLREMGEHRLKGLLNPERLLQIVAANLRADFPPLASLTSHSLPAERDEFVGRREPLAELVRRLGAGARLISVVGLGGTGKTRLVTRFGWRSLGEFPGGVWFCDLSEARSMDGIVYAVAQGLEVPLGQDDPVIQLGRVIAGRGRCLVILDNFEQVARHAQETLGRWLNRASDARFLATTREVLGLPGEEVLALAPLEPSDAAALFMCRAESAEPGFQPKAEDQEAIAPLVKLLEGLPLAIELASARVRIMPPRMLLSRMSERFKLLSSTGGRVDRQATLRAVLDWSWDLLSLSEKATLAQLSVFHGGFALASIEAIIDLSGYEKAPWPMDTLQSLVQKSLVRHVSDDRFDLLVSVQEYSAEHLRTAARFEGSGPVALLATERRHGAYFAGLDERDAIAGECIELDNFIVACRRAIARGEVEMAVRLLESAWAGLSMRGPFQVGLELASLVQAIPAIGPAAGAKVHWIAGHALESSGKHPEAYVHFEASRTHAREAGDRRCECSALYRCGDLDWNAGRWDAARLHLDAALTIARELNNPTLEGDAHNGLGNLECLLGRFPEARMQLEAAVALARGAGDQRRECSYLGNLGCVHLDAGNLDESRKHFEAALAVGMEIGYRRIEGNQLSNLGAVDGLQGRLTEALERYEAALAVARDVGSSRLEAQVLENLGEVYADLAQLEDAVNHFEAALALAREFGDQKVEGHCLHNLGLLRARQGDFNEARRCLDAGEALSRAISGRRQLAVLLCSRAETEHLAGVADAARDALAAANVIAAELMAGADSELGIALARVRNLLGQQQRVSVDGSTAP